VLVAHHLPRRGSHLVSVLARLHVRNLARRISLEAGEMREKRGWEERRNARNSVCLFCTEKRKMPVTRARVSRTGECSSFEYTPHKQRGLV
jgi:hypothetical protein